MTFLGTQPKPGRLATLGHECALTWGQDADGHEEHVLFFVKVQLLQANLEFHERLEQVHAVAGWEEKGPLAQPALEQDLPQLRDKRGARQLLFQHSRELGQWKRTFDIA